MTDFGGSFHVGFGKASLSASMATLTPASAALQASCVAKAAFSEAALHAGISNSKGGLKEDIRGSFAGIFDSKGGGLKGAGVYKLELLLTPPCF